MSQPLDHRTDTLERIIPVDLGFILAHCPNQGVDLAVDALNHRPQILDHLLDAGWHRLIRSQPPHTHARGFLSRLVHANDVQTAICAFNRFLEHATPDEINLLLTHKVHKSSEAPVMFQWIQRVPVDESLLHALFVAAKRLGGEFDVPFTYNSGMSSSQHTLLSATIARGQFSHILDGEQPLYPAARALIAAGKQFDKHAAATMVQELDAGHAKVWLEFFKGQGMAVAHQILKFTSRMKTKPDVLAMVQAEAALEAMNGVLVDSSKPHPTS